jgi:hypothetical protein
MLLEPDLVPNKELMKGKMKVIRLAKHYVYQQELVQETPGVVYEVYHTAEPPDDLVTDDILGYTKAYAKRIHAGAQHDDPEAKQIARITMALIYAQGLAEQSGENIETELHRLRDRVP